MQWKVRFILHHIQNRIRKDFIKRFDSEFYAAFCRQSQQSFKTLMPCIPDIGKSVFSLDYYFIICCFIWFDAFQKMGQSVADAALSIWFMIEEYLKSWPQSLLQFAGKNIYSGIHKRRAGRAVRMAQEGSLHSFDWKIQYQEFDKNTFQFDIYECGALKLAKKLELMELFPYVCRMDYLLSHYMGNEFKRKGTLADGDDCCDAWFKFPGYTPWPVKMDQEGRWNLK